MRETCDKFRENRSLSFQIIWFRPNEVVLTVLYEVICLKLLSSPPLSISLSLSLGERVQGTLEKGGARGDYWEGRKPITLRAGESYVIFGMCV